jgi:dimethylamine monooxygenase subunit A
MSAALFHKGPPGFGVGLAPIDPERWLFPDDQAEWLAGKAALLDERREEVFAQIDGGTSAQAEAFALIAPGRPAPCDEPALIAAGRLVSDDLVLLRKADEAWRVVAACLCSPTYFSVRQVIGQGLGAIHAPVPGGDPALAGRIVWRSTR